MYSTSDPLYWFNIYSFLSIQTIIGSKLGVVSPKSMCACSEQLLRLWPFSLSNEQFTQKIVYTN